MTLRSNDEWADLLIIPLYNERYLQTLWNAAKEQHRREGWTLKNKSWAPWFYNMRPIGDSPKLFHDVCHGMSDLISHHAPRPAAPALPATHRRRQRGLAERAGHHRQPL